MSDVNKRTGSLAPCTHALNMTMQHTCTQEDYAAHMHTRGLCTQHAHNMTMQHTCTQHDMHSTITSERNRYDNNTSERNRYDNKTLEASEKHRVGGDLGSLEGKGGNRSGRMLAQLLIQLFPRYGCPAHLGQNKATCIHKATCILPQTVAPRQTFSNRSHQIFFPSH